MGRLGRRMGVVHAIEDEPTSRHWGGADMHERPEVGLGMFSLRGWTPSTGT